MNAVVADDPYREIHASLDNPRPLTHLIIDNYATHPKVHSWIAWRNSRHRRQYEGERQVPARPRHPPPALYRRAIYETLHL
jgi:hypothetical protein